MARLRALEPPQQQRSEQARPSPSRGLGGGSLHRGGPSLVPPQHAHPQGPRAAPGGTLTCILTAITTEMSSFSSSLKTTSFFKVRLHNL